MIKLNRPRQLNALNTNMINLITPEILTYGSDESGCKTVLITSTTETGKAFCAGGDVRGTMMKHARMDHRIPLTSLLFLLLSAMVENFKAGGSYFRDFLFAEYRLNHIVGTLKVPVVSFWNGITST